MTTDLCYPRIAFLRLLLPLFLAIPLTAQYGDRQRTVSLTVGPDHITLHAGQTQRFSAELKGAPAGTVIEWAVWTVSNRRPGNISQDGVFTARAVGIYRIIAVAISNSTVLSTGVAKVTVVAQRDAPVFR
jgi:Bacterial Ig-like domain (group 2)